MNAYERKKLEADLADAKAMGLDKEAANIQLQLVNDPDLNPTRLEREQKYRRELGSNAAGMDAFERFSAGINSGLEDKKLGHKQSYDAITGGKNAQSLEVEAKEKAARDKDLFDTGFVAKAGNVLGQAMVDVPEMFAGGKLLGVVGKGVQAGGKMLPEPVQKFLQSVGRATPAIVKDTGPAAIKNFGGGAFAGTTTPSENYDFVKQAIQGAAAAVPGMIGARTAQHAVNPFRNYGPPEGGWPKNSPEANLAQRLLEMEGMPGILAENRVVRKGSGGIPGATNALSQVIVGGQGVRENRAKLRGAATENWTQGTGVTSPTMGPNFGRELDARGVEQWNKLRTHPDVQLEGIPENLQKALDDIRATPQVAPSLTDITSALDRAIQAASAKGAGKVNPNRPGIFGTLDDLANEQPGGPTLAQIVEQESSNLPGGPGRVAPPPMAPIDLWGISDPTTLAGNTAQRPFRSGSSTVQGAQPGFTEPGHPTGGPFTGSTRFHIPEEPPAPKLPSMSAEEFLRQHSEVSRRLRDASLPGGDANQRKLYGSLLDAMDTAAEKSWTPEQINDYRRVRAEEGHQRDTEKLKRASGDLVDPKAAMDVLAGSQKPGIDLAPQTPLHRRMEALDAQAPVPPVTENRAGMIGVETGNPIIGGVGGGWLSHLLGGGDPAVTALGTVAGVVGIPAASRAMSHFLLGTEGGGRYFTGQNESRVGKAVQSREFADFLERAGLSSANTIGQRYADDSKDWPYGLY